MAHSSITTGRYRRGHAGRHAYQVQETRHEGQNTNYQTLIAIDFGTAVLGQLFGEGTGTPITVTLGSITRQWNTFDEAVEEVIDARVYSGIHFRTADEVGARLGRQVAHFVSTHALRPSRKGEPRRP